ncbi:PLP-dependent aminotransferase family protein [Mammaliicoccus sp. Dog046]|uniref:MocR-like transcriptional regulator GabR n=1 Tax=Mammaliicoccus sp. Dog046 TaxID=3034233 RepID=UPI002B25662E|nr:PLP-dependent aminotransferase family protein [Mammaliicoccus sp. Dog046]WQK85209.1 PLP-dependent aminotransferase family protein [Mammaliicoccus sp. Dog046]
MEHSYKYREIYLKLKQDILSQQYSSHQKLPSKRQLANDQNVSINTVKNAYEQLFAEGYIYTKERQGYFVEALNQLIIQDEQITQPLNTQSIELNSTFQYSFSHMTTDITEFPIDVWSKHVKEAYYQFKNEMSEIPPFKGPFELRQSIAQLISYKRGVVCRPEQIIIGSGTGNLLSTLFQTFASHQKIAIENPGYSRMRQLFISMGQEIINVPLDKKGLSVNHIKSNQPDFIVTTPSHQFPTGTIMPISRRIELLNWVTEHNKFIIEDDYDSEYKYGTDNIPSLYSLDKNDRVIYLGTFSKTLMPSLRISYMILPQQLLYPFDLATHTSITDLSSINAYALHLFIKSGNYEKYIRKMHHIYSEKRECLLKTLKKSFKEDISIYDMKAGLHFLLNIKTNHSYGTIEQKASEKNIELYTLRRFMVDEPPESNQKTLIIGFAKIKLEDIEPAVLKLKEIFNED